MGCDPLHLACFGHPIPRVAPCTTVYKTTGRSVLVCAFAPRVMHATSVPFKLLGPVGLFHTTPTVERVVIFSVNHLPTKREQQSPAMGTRALLSGPLVLQGQSCALQTTPPFGQLSRESPSRPPSPGLPLLFRVAIRRHRTRLPAMPVPALHFRGENLVQSQLKLH